MSSLSSARTTDAGKEYGRGGEGMNQGKPIAVPSARPGAKVALVRIRTKRGIYFALARRRRRVWVLEEVTDIEGE